jgi:hypothetical protein
MCILIITMARTPRSKPSKKGEKRCKKFGKPCKKGGKPCKVSRKSILPLLEAIYSVKEDSLRKELILHLNDAGHNLIYECVHNCIYNRAIPKKTRLALADQLDSQKRTITYLADPDSDPVVKKKLLRQTGAGILPIILAAVLPLLTRILLRPFQQPS